MLDFDELEELEENKDSDQQGDAAKADIKGRKGSGLEGEKEDRQNQEAAWEQGDECWGEGAEHWPEDAVKHWQRGSSEETNAREDEDEEEDEDEDSRPRQTAEETEEDKLRREENDRFRAEIQQEIEVEMRIRKLEQAQDEKGIPGVTLKVPTKDPKEPKGSRKKIHIFFLDLLNEALSVLYKLLMSKRRGPGLNLYGVQWQLNMFAAFVHMLMQCRFNASSATGFCERLVELFHSSGKERGLPAGLCALFKELLEEDEANRRPVKEIVGLIDATFKNITGMLRKLVATTVGTGSEGKAFISAHLDAFIKDFCPPCRPCALPVDPIDPELQLQVALYTIGWSSPHEICCSKHWSVEDLRMILLAAGFPHDIHLGPPSGGSFPAPSATPLEATGCVLLLVTQDMAWLEQAVGGHEELYWHPQWCAVSWTRSKILKTTPESATRLLYELRAAFQAPDFQERYMSLRENSVMLQKGNVKMIEMTFGVQSEVIPRYGFAASPKGVQEMRDEMAVHADFTGKDPLVAKVRKDIHTILDMFQPLPLLPIIRPMYPERFEVSDRREWIRHLADQGFVVLANVATMEQVSTAYGLLWDFIEASDSSKKVCRNDINTWGDSRSSRCGWPAGIEDGIIHQRGIGQSKPMWSLRGLPKLRQVFADLWGTDNLVTSFDGAGVFRPYGHKAEWRTKKANWHHVDQAHRKRGLHCVQGLVTLKDATERTGGLVVVPRSHRFHNDILRDYKPSKDGWDFIAINANDRVITADGGGPRLVCARAGDLLLWDSRTIHCNTLPLAEDHELLQGFDLIRAVAYICMTPAAWCSEEVMQKRATAFNRGVTTSHWPHEYHSMSASHTDPGFGLSPEQRELLLPTTLNQGEAGLRPGCLSCGPEAQFQVQAHAPVRRSPTLEWGRTVGSLRHGQTVTGYVFGDWVQLTSWPEGQVSVDVEDEAWCSLRDEDGQPQLQYLRDCPPRQAPGLAAQDAAPPREAAAPAPTSTSIR